MTHINITVCCPKDKPQHYQIYLDHDDLGVALDLASRFVAAKCTLQQVCLLEDGYCVHLPAGAFDGQPIGVHLQALQQQWQAILRPE